MSKRMGKNKHHEGKGVEGLPEKVEIEKDMRKLEANIANMYKEYERFMSRKRSKRLPMMKHYLDFFYQWMEVETNYEDNEKFAGGMRSSSEANAQSKMQSFNPYNQIGLEWNFRYELALIRKLRSSLPRIKEAVMFQSLCLAKGMFNHVKQQAIGPARMMASFYCTVELKNILVFCILPERVPILIHGQVHSYAFRQYIRFLDLIQHESQVHRVVDKAMKKISTHPDKFLCFQVSDKKEMTYREDSEESSSVSSITSVVNTGKGRYGVTAYLPKMKEKIVNLTKKEMNDITFNAEKKRWESKTEGEEASIFGDFFEQVLAREENRRALREIASAESCKWLVSFFEKIPNFRMKLTEEEKVLIGEPGNILAIGRSGTGKTTCALLRLFATEILFKVKNVYARSSILKDTRFRAEDVDSSCGLHTVFVTASPVLTNEVRRYYDKLNEKIKRELLNKEVRRKKAGEAREEMEIVSITEVTEVAEEEKKESLGMEEIREIEEELELVDEGELEKQLALAHCLNHIPDDQFPLFLTIRRLILMIDGTLRRPFFSRNPKGDIVGLEGNAEWHNENRGVMMINSQHKLYGEDSVVQDLEAEDPNKILDQLEREEEENEYELDLDEEEAQRMEDLKRRRSAKNTQRKTHYMGREIDFEIFVKKFWPTVVGKVHGMSHSEGHKMTPASLWREIQTHIKGGVDAHEYAAHHIPRFRYQELTKNRTNFSEDGQHKVYEIFYLYERWAYESNYYDMSDVVNHILSQIKWNGYRGQPIHFAMCDEVQDLPPATLLMLLKITEQNLFFSGDTAQTIAQGISFRFADLRSLFYNAKLDSGMPNIMQLSINFRSHARILDLANSVIRVLELYFPSSIDKLKKEKSPYDGTLPIVLDSELHDSLFNLLLGSHSDAKAKEGLLARPPLEFGCDQVIIVRNQKAKDALPNFLKHALCLTIYEAKGLEFDDVILYNFFTDSEVPDEFKLLRGLSVEGVKVPLNFFESEFKQTFDQLTVQPLMLPEEYKELKEGEYMMVKNVSPAPRMDNVESKFSALTTELKQLYTAITRPRHRLIIFDENPGIRQPMLDYWMALGYIQVISKSELDPDRVAEPGKDSAKLLESLSGANTSKAGWRSQGIRMFRRKYYQQAAKCFQHSGDEDLRLRAQAYYDASRGSEVLAEVDAINYSLKVEDMKKEEKKLATAKVEDLSRAAERHFKEAAEEFSALKMKMQAGQCFFSIQDYAKAAECFEECGQYGQAGEAYFKMKQYLKAGELYEQAGVPSNAIIAYEKLKDWELVLNCIHKFKEQLAPDHRGKLVRKYIQLALQAIFEEYEEAQAESALKSEEGVKKEELEAIKEERAGAVSEHSEVISSSAAEESKIVENDLNPFEEVDKSRTSSNNNPFEEVDLSMSGEKAAVKEEEKSEFSMVDEMENKSSKFIDEDHIAGLDPEDEWIQCETGSIIESVVSGKISASNKSSDYSMIDNVHAFAVNCSLVKTRRDIFVEDQAMSKVIRYVSYFSEEVQNTLESLRSKSVLLHKQEKDTGIGKSTADFIIDMDDIDVAFVNLLLDVLEQLGLYKLCIIICNRYQINERLGRYVVSIAHKYSNIKLVCDAYEKYSAKESTFREMQLRNSIIANSAVHKVFEVVNPLYLKPKKYLEMADEANSLGAYCYRSLLLLGYWKKLVYIMDCEASLALTSAFSDYTNYKLIYLMNFGELNKGNVQLVHKQISDCSFEWVPFKSPSNSMEKSAMLVAYDSVIWELNRSYPFTYQHPRSAEHIPIKTVRSFPAEFRCSQAFWNVVLDPVPEHFLEFESKIMEASTEFLKFDQGAAEKKGLEVFLWDYCNTVIQMLYGKRNESVAQLWATIDTKVYNTLLQCIYKLVSILCFGKTPRVFMESYYWVYLASLAALGIRRLDAADLSVGLGRYFVMHRDSVLFSRAMQIGRERKVERRRQIEARIASEMPRHYTMSKSEFEQYMQEKLREAMEEEHNKLDAGSDILFADLETEYALVDPELILEELGRDLTKVEDRNEGMVKHIASAAEIWSLDDHAALRTEVYHTAMRIGEASFTLRLWAMFNPEAQRELRVKTQKVNVVDYYFDRIDERKKQEEMQMVKAKGKLGMASKKKKKKASAITAIQTLVKSRKSLYYKLQYMSVCLFAAGSHTHINAEDWVLESIQTALSSVFLDLPEGIENEMFPTFCTYLAVDKYILFVEQLRALQFTRKKKIGYNYMTWLDAVAEYKTGCLEDCYNHLIQFFNDNRSELDVLSKLITVEKAVVIAQVLVNSIRKNKSGPMTSNLLKHAGFVKLTEGKYRLEVFMREPEYDAEVKEILEARNAVVMSLIADTGHCYSLNKRQFVFEAVQTLLCTMGLNVASASEAATVTKMGNELAKETALRLKFVSKFGYGEWMDLRRQCEARPDLLEFSGVFRTEWAFAFSVVQVEFAHSDSKAPDVEKLEKDGLREYREMALHSIIYRTLRDKKLNKEIVKQHAHPFSRAKHEMSLELIRKAGPAVTPEVASEFIISKRQGFFHQLSEAVKDAHIMVLNTFYKTPIFNVLDAHYLFTLLEDIDYFREEVVKLTAKAIVPSAKVEEKKKSEGLSGKEVRDGLERLRQELQIWKNNKFMPDKEYIERKKIIYNSKWRQHKREQHEKRIARRAGRRKQVLLMKKADALKGKVRDILSFI